MDTATLKSWIRSGLVVLLALGGMRVSAQVDCLGVDGGVALPGTPCDDGSSFTPIDVWSTSCQCVGFCGGGTLQPGSTCDDGSALTINDVIWWDCGCAGTGIVDCNGVEFGPDQIGTPCDDGNSTTLNDRWSSYCACIGVPNDCLGVNGGNAVYGTPCDDDNPFTNNDNWYPGLVGCVCGGQTTRISGRVFLDRNEDGIYNSFDYYWPGRVMEIYRAGHPSQFIQTAWNASYSAVLDTGTYGLRVVLGVNETQGIPDPVVTFSAYGASSYNNDIPITYDGPVSDLQTRFSACTPPARPGFNNYIYPYIRNLGNVPLPATMQVTLDTDQTLLYTVPPGEVNGNTVTWELDTIQPGWASGAQVWLHTDSTVALFTPIEYTVLVTPPYPDDRPENDTTTRSTHVVGSYDPNDKLVNPSSLALNDVESGMDLTYTIRFQNTGTYLAERVILRDTLSALLDHSTFEYVESSHPSQWTITNGVLSVLYDHIMLPDSGASQVESNGYFMFRIKPQSFLQPGASVPNSASIFFDFNQPIHTNIAVVSVELNTAITSGAVEALAPTLWPNPVADLLNISVERPTRTTAVTIIDMNGRSVRNLANVAVQGGTLTLSVSDLADGLYTLRIGDGLKAVHQRFVKSH